MQSEPIGIKGLIEQRRALAVVGELQPPPILLSTYAYAYSNPLSVLDSDGLYGKLTPEQAVYKAVLQGNQSKLEFLLQNVATGRFSPTKKLLLRSQCKRNAAKIREGTLDVTNAERRLVDALERLEDAPGSLTPAQKLVEFVRAILQVFGQ